MGILQKKCRTTGKKALTYRGKDGQNTGIAFPALRLGVVLYLLTLVHFPKRHSVRCTRTSLHPYFPVAQNSHIFFMKRCAYNWKIIPPGL